MKGVSSSIKMAKQAANWRQSSALIILSQDSANCENKQDLKVLLFDRSEATHFMPKSSVFPGGVRESADESPLWLKHFQSFGLQNEQLRKLILERRPDIHPQPHIFKTEPGDRLHRDISLRITAIRETFEEMGIMICRNRKSLDETDNTYGSFLEDFDRLHWQQAVHNDPSEFLNLCKTLDIVPDVWSLHEWSVWLTPASFKKRFEAAFYLVAVKQMPHVILEENEGTDFQWLTPKEALLQDFEGKIWLPPPQHLEISRLLNFKKLNEIQRFAHNRAKNGTILMLPVQVQCDDGLVSLYPGDSMYPDNPNECTTLEVVNMTMGQYRANAKKLHRFEIASASDSIIHMNFDSVDGHMRPLNIKSNSML